jgi:hypothetical protein
MVTLDAAIGDDLLHAHHLAILFADSAQPAHWVSAFLL